MEDFASPTLFVSPAPCRRLWIPVCPKLKVIDKVAERVFGKNGKGGKDNASRRTAGDCLGAERGKSVLRPLPSLLELAHADLAQKCA